MTSPLAQCIGPEFAVKPDGSLVARLADGPAGAALPSSGNGLRVDPVKGLWAPAAQTLGWVRDDRTDNPGNVVINPGGTRKSGVMKTTITNSHPTRPMVCLLTIDVTAVFNISANNTDTSYTGWGLDVGVDVDANPTHAVPLDRMRGARSIGASSEAGMVESVSRSLHVFLDPASTADVRTQLALTCYEDGYVRYIRSYMTMTGLAVTR